MIGAIAGDIIGSRFEFNNTEDKDFVFIDDENTFTDDSVLTVATASVLMSAKDTKILDHVEFVQKYQEYFNTYPNRGWGGMFWELASKQQLRPYNSFGNGSAMRVSAISWFAKTVEEALQLAEHSAAATHSHFEGIRGAQAIALAGFLAKDHSKDDIKILIEKTHKLCNYNFDYDNSFDETCQVTVPKALAIFHKTNSYEEAIRESILSGGDVDTIACIVGGIAQAHYGLPSSDIIDHVYSLLSIPMADVLTEFTINYIDPSFVAPQVMSTYNPAHDFGLGYGLNES